MTTTSTQAAAAPAPLARQSYGLLTTYRRNGAPVGTAVPIAVAGDHAFVRTYDRTGKDRRFRRDRRVAVAPSTVRGVPAGPACPAAGRFITGSIRCAPARP